MLARLTTGAPTIDPDKDNDGQQYEKRKEEIGGPEPLIDDLFSVEVNRCKGIRIPCAI